MVAADRMASTVALMRKATLSRFVLAHDGPEITRLAETFGRVLAFYRSGTVADRIRGRHLLNSIIEHAGELVDIEALRGTHVTPRGARLDVLVTLARWAREVSRDDGVGAEERRGAKRVYDTLYVAMADAAAGLIRSAVRRYGGDPDDLGQAAHMALLDAVSGYDIRKGAASGWLKGRLENRLQREAAGRLGLSRYDAQARTNVVRVLRDADARGVRLDVSDIVELTGLPVEAVTRVYQHLKNPAVRLDKPAKSDEGKATLGDLLVTATADPNTSDEVDDDPALRQMVLDVIATFDDLPPWVWWATVSRLGLSGETPMRYREIANRVGINPESVRQAVHAVEERVVETIRSDPAAYGLIADAVGQDTPDEDLHDGAQMAFDTVSFRHIVTDLGDAASRIVRRNVAGRLAQPSLCLWAGAGIGEAADELVAAGADPGVRQVAVDIYLNGVAPSEAFGDGPADLIERTRRRIEAHLIEVMRRSPETYAVDGAIPIAGCAAENIAEYGGFNPSTLQLAR